MPILDRDGKLVKETNSPSTTDEQQTSNVESSTPAPDFLSVLGRLLNIDNGPRATPNARLRF